MAPTQDNPRGYWENDAVYRTNEAVLEELDASWFDPPTPEQMKAAPHLRADVGSALDLLIGTAANAPVVLKDPRIGVLLDLWGPALEGRLHPVLVVRPPTEVASSLATRDGTPRAFGLAEWEIHLTRVLRYLRGRTVTVAPYTGLLADPSRASLVVNAAAGHLDASRRALVDAAKAPAAMIGDLRRHRTDPGELAECLTAAQNRLWRTLSGLPLGDQVIELPEDFTGEPSRAALEAARDETRRLAALHATTRLGDRLGAVDAERNALAAERDALAAERDTLAAERDALAAERDALAAERDRSRPNGTRSRPNGTGSQPRSPGSRPTPAGIALVLTSRRALPRGQALRTQARGSARPAAHGSIDDERRDRRPALPAWSKRPARETRLPAKRRRSAGSDRSARLARRGRPATSGATPTGRGGSPLRSCRARTIRTRRPRGRTRGVSVRAPGFGRSPSRPRPTAGSARPAGLPTPIRRERRPRGRPPRGCRPPGGRPFSSPDRPADRLG